MPNKVRLFSASFNNAYEAWMETLPASSREDFIRMYGNIPNVRLNDITIMHLGFFDIELSANGFTPNFYVPGLKIFFDEECQGYSYLTRYFSQFVNQLRNAEHQYHKEQEEYYVNR